MEGSNIWKRSHCWMSETNQSMSAGCWWYLDYPESWFASAPKLLFMAIVLIINIWWTVYQDGLCRFNSFCWTDWSRSKRVECNLDPVSHTRWTEYKCCTIICLKRSSLLFIILEIPFSQWSSFTKREITLPQFDLFEMTPRYVWKWFLSVVLLYGWYRVLSTIHCYVWQINLPLFNGIMFLSIFRTYLIIYSARRKM